MPPLPPRCLPRARVSPAAGLRIEWFRDNHGSRVFYGVRNAVTASKPVAGGFVRNFWAISWCLKWRIHSNWTIRLDLRHDWFTLDGYGSGALPFGDVTTRLGGLVTGSAFGQLYYGCDAVATF